MSAGLTVRGVKLRLSRAGVDYSGLAITSREQTVRQVDIGYSGPWKQRHIVVVDGPKAERRRARRVLGEAGLWCAPYGDHDEWWQ